MTTPSFIKWMRYNLNGFEMTCNATKYQIELLK